MADVDIFRDKYLSNAEQATVTYAQWKKQQPGEFQKWVAYRDAILAGEWFPNLPTMASKFGKALVAVGRLAERDDMKVTLSCSGGTQNLTGTQTLAAVPTPLEQVTSVRFYVDDVLKSTDASSPFTYSWNTTQVQDGSHQLKAQVTYGRNKMEEKKLTVTVLNTVEPPPDPSPNDPPVNTTAPSISGTATQGQTLTIYHGVWTNDPTNFTRQWVRCDAAGANGVPIPSATGSSYVLTAADVTKTIRCAVTAYNAIGPSAAEESAQTAVVASSAPAVPVNSSLPVLTGTAQIGNAISCSTGGWTNSPTSYTYQWQRCNSSGASCVNISGATANSYLLATADVGQTVRCQAKGVNGAGTSTAASTAVTAVVQSLPPPPPPPPSYIKTLDSSDAYPVGLSSDSEFCGLIRPSALGEMFDLQASCVRCTWTNTNFSHMGRHEVFDVQLRFDARPVGGTSWEQIIMLRPYGTPWGNVNCASGGNSETMLLRLWVDYAASPDAWKLDIRGGASVHPDDQDGNLTRLSLGSVVEGQIMKLGFDIVSDYAHGACSVWKNDVLVYDDRDRPFGFHYDCNGTDDVSDYALRMQHGVYRGGGGAVKLSSSGFRFTVSES